MPSAVEDDQAILAELLRNLEVEFCVRTDLAAGGWGLRHDDAARTASRGDGSNTPHFEACLFETVTSFPDGLADKPWAQVRGGLLAQRNQDIYGGASELRAFR